MIITNVRFSYLNAFKAAKNPSGVMKYSAAILIPKNSKQLPDITEAINKAAEVGVSKNKFTVQQTKNLRLPLRDGDKEFESGDRGKEYKGYFFINASSDNAPGVVNAHLEPIIDPEEFYSGCYGHADVNFFPYNAGGNRGIGVGLNNLLMTKEGERLDGRQAAEDAFANHKVEVSNEPDSEELL